MSTHKIGFYEDLTKIIVDLFTIGMLQAGMHDMTSRNSIIAIRQLYRSSEIVTRLLGR